MSDESVVDPFQNKYEAFYSMGNSLFKSKQYKRAIWYLSQAIESDKSKMRPLIERANCFLQLSKYDKALEDIEIANSINKKDLKALLLQGEIYYQKGEFEKALTIFQRGKQRRSTMYEFQLGINKCEMCIKNASASDNPKHIELNYAIDLEEFYEEAFPDIKEQKLAKIKQKALSQKKKTIKDDSPKIYEDDLPLKMPPIPFNKRTMRQLLESEGVDRKYVKDVHDIEEKRVELINSAYSVPEAVKKQKIKYSQGIQRDTLDAAVFLDNRIRFWYRQNPCIITELNRNKNNPEDYDSDVLPQISNNSLIRI